MPRRPQVPVEERRKELVEVALRVMARDGAWALTTRAVAREAGVPHGSVHYAFSSKAELIRAVVAHDTARASAALGEASQEDGPPRQKLRRAMSAYADSLVADPELELAMQELILMAARDADLRAVVDDDFHELVHDLLASVGDTWDAPLQTIAHHVMSAIFGASQSWLVDRDEALLRMTLQDVADTAARRLS